LGYHADVLFEPDIVRRSSTAPPTLVAQPEIELMHQEARDDQHEFTAHQYRWREPPGRAAPFRYESNIMTGVQVFVVVVAVAFAAGAFTVIWIRKRRSGGVLIADPSDGANHRAGRR
jgi:hypothetical protein